MINEHKFNKHILTISSKQWDLLFSLINNLDKDQAYCVIIENYEKAPRIKLSKSIKQVLSSLHSLNLFIEFDYLSWKEKDKLIAYTNYSSFQSITICKLLTVMVKNEKFCHGTIVRWFETKIAIQLLKQLQKNIEQL